MSGATFFVLGDCHFVITLVIASKERISLFLGPGQCIQLKEKNKTGGGGVEDPEAWELRDKGTGMERGSMGADILA